MATTLQEPTLSLFSPGIDPQDIEQEAQLLILEGKVPNRRLIRARLQPRELCYTAVEGSEQAEAFEPQTTFAAEEVIEQLVSWALNQTETIQEQIYTFLEEPEDELEHTLALLQREHLLTETTAPSQLRGSATQLILRSLPAGFDALVHIITEVSQPRRPHATVRQALRTLTRKQAIELDEQTQTYRRIA
jgi:hypothetical protein